LSTEFSVIIPTYNSAPTLRLLLNSLQRQTAPDFEVIVVDDASTDLTPDLVAQYPVRYLRLDRNQGPAAARNRGAAQAQGDWLVFTDADTEFAPDTMAEIAAVLAASDADALVGSYAGEPANPGFMPRYKALWEYFIVDMTFQTKGRGLVPSDAWAPRPGIVRRTAFRAVSGFDTRFRGADIEDLDFGYRLVEKGYRNYFAPNVRIKHHYPATLAHELRPFARRCVFWMRVNSRRRKFDTAGEGSPRQALGHLCGFVAFLLFPAGGVRHVLWVAAGLMLLGYLGLHWKFLALAYRREGLTFALGAAAVCWLHTIVLGFAAGYGLLTRLLGVR
jgi:glycosyltransferase involved in cell wall biosynthesis